MELHKLHVGQGRPGAQGQGHAVAGVGGGVGIGEKDPAITAGAHQDPFALNAEDAACGDIHGHHAADVVVAVGDQLQDMALLVDRHFGFYKLLPKGVQHHLAGAVGGVTGAVEAGAAEGALGDLALLQA